MGIKNLIVLSTLLFASMSLAASYDVMTIEGVGAGINSFTSYYKVCDSMGNCGEELALPECKVQTCLVNVTDLKDTESLRFTKIHFKIFNPPNPYEMDMKFPAVNNCIYDKDHKGVWMYLSYRNYDDRSWALSCLSTSAFALNPEPSANGVKHD